MYIQISILQIDRIKLRYLFFFVPSFDICSGGEVNDISHELIMFEYGQKLVSINYVTYFSVLNSSTNLFHFQQVFNVNMFSLF